MKKFWTVLLALASAALVAPIAMWQVQETVGEDLPVLPVLLVSGFGLLGGLWELYVPLRVRFWTTLFLVVVVWVVPPSSYTPAVMIVLEIILAIIFGHMASLIVSWIIEPVTRESQK